LIICTRHIMKNINIQGIGNGKQGIGCLEF
jgi:hypothetical protein